MLGQLVPIEYMNLLKQKKKEEIYKNSIEIKKLPLHFIALVHVEKEKISYVLQDKTHTHTHEETT